MLELSTVPFGSQIRELWPLDTDGDFLNHGSFGATPKPFLEEQGAIRDRMESNPVRFMEEEAPELVRAAATELAGFLGCRSEDLVFSENATAGVNAVMRSFFTNSLKPGDEVVTTTHSYGAVHKTLRYVCGATGAKLIEASVPYPLQSPDEVTEAVSQVLSDRAKLLVVGHITSASALIFPIQQLVDLARAQRIKVLVDGAHAPGMVPLDLSELDADWYTGNCHKWLCAPKGCAFLYSRTDLQQSLHPLVISHGYENGFTEEFDWTGTRDMSAWLTIPRVLTFWREVGIERARAYMKELAWSAATKISKTWNTEIPAPPEMFGSIVTIRVPGDFPGTEEWVRCGASSSYFQGVQYHRSLYGNWRTPLLPHICSCL